MSLDKIYYDSFEDSYVLTKDVIAPPERYIPTYKGENGIYIESWEVNDHKNCCMNIAFNENNYYDTNNHYAILRNMMEKNHCKLTRLRYFVIPEHKFDEYVEYFNLEEGYTDQSGLMPAT